MEHSFFSVGHYYITMPGSRNHSNGSRRMRKSRRTRRSAKSRHTFKGVDARLYGMHSNSETTRPGTQNDIARLYSKFTAVLAVLTYTLTIGTVVTNPLEIIPTPPPVTDAAEQLRQILEFNTQQFVTLAFQLGSSGLPEASVAPSIQAISELLDMYMDAWRL